MYMNICRTPKATLRVPRPPVQTPPPQLAVQQRLGKETKTVHVQMHICSRAHATSTDVKICTYLKIWIMCTYVYMCVSRER